MLLSIIGGCIHILTSIVPATIDVGVQLWNVRSVNNIFQENNCVHPSSHISRGRIFCEGNSNSGTCEVDCSDGYVPSIYGSKSFCSHGAWDVDLENLKCVVGLVLIVGGTNGHGMRIGESEIYSGNHLQFKFPSLPTSSIFTNDSRQFGELLNSIDSNLEYMNGKVILCGSTNIYSLGSLQQLSDHCIYIKSQGSWSLHSQLTRNRSLAASEVVGDMMVMVGGDDDHDVADQRCNLLQHVRPVAQG